MQLSLTRLGLLLHKQWVENRKIYIIGMLVLVGIMLVTYFFASEGRGLQMDAQGAIFIAGLFISSTIFSTTILNRYSNKTSTIQELMLPASALEKTIAAIIYSMVLYPLLYILIIYPVSAIVNYIGSEVFGYYNLLFELSDLWEPENMCLYLLLQSGILLCSVLFRQHVLIKSVLVLCIFFFGTIYLNDKIAKRIIGNKQPTQLPSQYHGPVKALESNNYDVFSEDHLIFTINATQPFGSVQLRSARRDWIVEPTASQQFWFMLLYFAAVPLLWVITWFMLREKQL